MIKKLAFILLFLFPFFLFSQENNETLYPEEISRLYHSINSSNLESVKLLIESNKVSANSTYKYGPTPLMLAAEGGYVTILDYLLSKGANVDARMYESGITALMLSAYNDKIVCSEKIIRAGADINKQDTLGITALHYAVIKGLYTHADMLLYYDADHNIKDSIGYTPIFYAMENDDIEIVDLLLQNGADKTLRANDASSLLHLAASNGNIEFVEKNISSIKYSSNNIGQTPLDCAIAYGQSEMVNWFLANGYKLEESINNLFTPYTLAKFSGDKKTKKIIKEINNKESYFLYFRRIFLGTERFMNTNFALVSFSCGVAEDRYGFQIETGILNSIYTNKILFPHGEDVYLQLRETRRSAFLALSKKIKLFRLFKKDYFSLDARFRTAYFWGNYKGVDIKFTKQVLFSPSLGISYTRDDFADFYFMSEYLDFPMLKNHNPFFFNLGIKMFLNFRNDKTEERYKYIINY